MILGHLDSWHVHIAIFSFSYKRTSILSSYSLISSYFLPVDKRMRLIAGKYGMCIQLCTWAPSLCLASCALRASSSSASFFRASVCYSQNIKTIPNLNAYHPLAHQDDHAVVTIDYRDYAIITSITHLPVINPRPVSGLPGVRESLLCLPQSLPQSPQLILSISQGSR